MLVSEPPLPPPIVDPFALFTRTLAESIDDAGGIGLGRVVAKVLGEERIDDEMPESAVFARIAGCVLERGPRGLARTESFTRVAVAWSGVLSEVLPSEPRRRSLYGFRANGPRLGRASNRYFLYRERARPSLFTWRGPCGRKTPDYSSLTALSSADGLTGARYTSSPSPSMITLSVLYAGRPVPAGIKRPMMTFSLRPRR